LARVLTADVRFEGWTVEYWQRFLDLWRPAASMEREAPRGGLFFIHDKGRVRKALHTIRGRVEPPPTWPAPLGMLAEEHRARWVVAAHEDALAEVMERFGSRARPADDILDQALSLVSIVREMIEEGSIESWPRRLRSVPVPTTTMVRRALDATCADGKCIALGTFQDGDLWTAIVARRRGSGFDVVAGPYELRANMGLLSGDWRRDQRFLVETIEESYGELALGCFAETGDLRALVMDPRPGAWSRAALLREIVLSPLPPSIALAVGVDSARYAFEGVRQVASRVDWLGLVDPAVEIARKRLGRLVGDKDLPQVLGFNPLEALRALLRRE
jgi:hypothetical protein